ncbi:MAG: ribonuclease P protein component [Armatimonadetes bacterium]|nr:ribonuclease P protein component [Armatimonadota bacterium]
MEIDTVFRSRKAVSTPALTLHFSRNSVSRNRVVIMAGKKVGTSVVRNRARRVIWEFLRSSEPLLRQGMDMVWVVRPELGGKSNSEIRSLEESLLKEAGIWAAPKEHPGEFFLDFPSPHGGARGGT